MRVRVEPPALRKEMAGLEVDLSSIAPGYAVDQLVETLRQFKQEEAGLVLESVVPDIGAGD